MRKEKRHKKKDFSDYILDCFLDKMECFGKNSGFLMNDIVNPNRKQIPRQLWENLISNHLRKYKYN